MGPTIRISAWSMVSVLAVAGEPTGPGTESTLKPTPECQVAAQWVAAHPGSLPTREVAISEFSPVYRRAIFRALPVSVQRSLWREHLTARLGEEYGLTAAQRMIVADAITNLDVFFNERLSRADRRAAVTAFMLSAGRGFSDSLRTDVFARLGSAPGSMDPRGAAFMRTARMSATTFQSVANPFGRAWSSGRAIICECNVAAQDCPGQECDSGASNCGLTEEGCGPMNLFSCDGLCIELVASTDRKRAN
jgi:hypothetical protein